MAKELEIMIKKKGNPFQDKNVLVRSCCLFSWSVPYRKENEDLLLGSINFATDSPKTTSSLFHSSLSIFFPLLA